MILSIDIGGTAVKMGLVDRTGRIHAHHEASVCYDEYKTPILTTVIREAKRFAADVNIEGIGVSATGQVDDCSGVVIGTNGKIPGYEGSRIREELEKAFGVPTRVLNDANAAALGESFAGIAKNIRNAIMITLGTGVGGGIIIDRKVFGGTKGIAGELGHFTLYQNGERCACGKNGCYESYAATTALVRLAERMTGEKELDGREIFRRAAEGDSAMLNAIDLWTDDVAAGITGLVHIFNPEMVVIGGGVSAQTELLLQPVRKKILAGVMPRFAEDLRIEGAALGNDAGLIGAAKFFMDRE